MTVFQKDCFLRLLRNDIKSFGEKNLMHIILKFIYLKPLIDAMIFNLEYYLANTF